MAHAIIIWPYSLGSTPGQSMYVCGMKSGTERGFSLSTSVFACQYHSLMVYTQLYITKWANLANVHTKPFFFEVLCEHCREKLLWPFFFWCFFDRASQHRIISSTNFNAPFNNTCISHYSPRHVSGLDMPILRRNNCTNTASGILAVLSGCTLHRLRAVCSKPV